MATLSVWLIGTTTRGVRGAGDWLTT